MVFPRGYNRQEGHVQAGYRMIQNVRKHDRWWYAWKALSQLMMILLIGMGAYITYGYYRGWAVWQWATAFWAIMTIRNICEFMAGRWK